MRGRKERGDGRMKEKEGGNGNVGGGKRGR